VANDLVTRTFSIVDLAGFTALTEAHGDVEAADLAVRFADLASELLEPDDSVVKTLGDAVLLASSGPRAGLELVSRLLDRCQSLDDFPLVRAGLHHGPAAERGTDYFGSSVNLTARVAGQASGSQVLVTDTVVAAARDLGLKVVDLGHHELRNVAESTHLWEVALVAHQAGLVIDPVCRMRVDTSQAGGWLRHDEAEFWFCSLTCVGRFLASPSTYTQS